MKIEGHPFPVNMVHTNEANKRNYRTYQQNKFNSTRLISKYQKKQDKQIQIYSQDSKACFDPH